MTPNPGSPEAKKQGCVCPVLDNNHGKYPPWIGDWWVSVGCPLHDHDFDVARALYLLDPKDGDRDE